jgi:hypothetical protein
VKGRRMDIVRNSIIISGIAAENELPKGINGQLIEYSEIDYAYIPGNMPPVSRINKIDVKVSCQHGRTINAPSGRIIVLDGTKNISLDYISSGYYQGDYTVNLEMPFNTFIDLPNNAGEVKAVDVYIVDAYFRMVSSGKIYNHILYMVNVSYPIISEKRRIETDINITTL